jgi:hypothetical protein
MKDAGKRRSSISTYLKNGKYTDTKFHTGNYPIAIVFIKRG